MKKINVVVWNENKHERESEAIRKVYPEGIHGAIAKHLRLNDDFIVKTATQEQEEHGLTQEVLDETDVLIWWGHLAHHLVSDEVVNRVYERVQDGMGLIVLHSGHSAKIFEKLMGTRVGRIKWREDGLSEKIWVIEHNHPIAKGLGDYFVLPQEEMYGERFDIPKPDDVIFISNFEGGEVFRSGVTFTRGYGKIFYFRPGHEEYPIYYNSEVMRVIENAVEWACPAGYPKAVQGHYPGMGL